MNDSLSIVVPAFDEETRLAVSLVKILEHIDENSLNAELIVVDDGSTDDTRKIAEGVVSDFRQIETRVIGYEENRGKGYAVRKGMQSAGGEIVLFSDADLSTPISELDKLVGPISRNEIDVAFGSRALDRNLIGSHQPWRREQGGKVFNLLVRTMTGLPFWDTQCGFKAFEMKKFRPLLELMRVDRFGFDVEFLYVADLHGLRLKEVPVRWNHCDGTKVSIFRDSFRMFGEIRDIRKNAKAGRYD